jgi:predicted amidohydrolase YtcJ
MDLAGNPQGGFQPENALTREETLRGMTSWAALSCFEEDSRGSLEIGKFADFIILDRDIMIVPVEQLPGTNVISTFVNGEKVYSRE